MLKKAGLDVEFFFTEGGGQTLQVITSGSVDVAMSNGLLGTIGAYSKKAPIRVISAQMTGAHELYWYVRAESKIRSLKDATEKNTIAFSSPGSSSNLILLALLNQAGSKARPTATGGLPGTLTSVMTGQIDIGWATPPFALRELQEKKIIIVARAREATELRNQTIRVNIANVNSLKTKRDAITRLMQVYHEAIEWSYSNPRAIEYFAEFAKAPRDDRRAGGEGILPERGAADRRDPRPRADAARRRAVQVHGLAADAAGRRRAVRHPLQAAGEVSVTRDRLMPVIPRSRAALIRPSTSSRLAEDVDARHEAGHDALARHARLKGLAMPNVIDDLCYQLALANRIVAHEGVLDGFGHISVRHPDKPDHYLLSRSRSPELVEPGDILELDIDSEVVTPGDILPYGECVIHGEIFRARPDVMAIVHHHSPAILPFCLTDLKLVPINSLGATMGAVVPSWDSADEFGDTPMVLTTNEQGASLARALGPHAMVLMRRHGATVVGALAQGGGVPLDHDPSQRRAAAARAHGGQGHAAQRRRAEALARLFAARSGRSAAPGNTG